MPVSTNQTYVADEDIIELKCVTSEPALSVGFTWSWSGALVIVDCELLDSLPDTGDKFSIIGCPVNNATHITTTITMDVMGSAAVMWQCDVDFFFVGTVTIEKYSKSFFQEIVKFDH